MIDDVRAKYSQAFHQHGDDDKSVFLPKGRQFLRYDNMLLQHLSKGATILDFGCGLAKMVEWLQERNRTDIIYTGADITPEFITNNRQKFFTHEFVQINDHRDLKGRTWDFVAASGVFNLLYTNDRESHKSYVFEVLKFLFENCTNKFMVVDFMHDQVDFMQEGAFHPSIHEIDGFVSHSLSRRYEIVRSYLPYEFCVKIWKTTALAPNGIYSEGP